MPSIVTDRKLQNSKVTVQYICKQLGFGDGCPRPQSQLTNYTHDHRKEYVSTDGKFRVGTDLFERQTEEGDHDLLVMTQDFLDRGGHGELLWPSHGAPSLTNTLEYDRDQHRITELLQTLFWRQNSTQNRKAIERANHEASWKASLFAAPSTEGQPAIPRDGTLWGQPSTTSSLPHKEPSARSTGNQTRVRATYDTAQSPSEDRRQPSVDLSDDGLPSWRGMKERAKSTPKRPQGTIEKSTSVDLDPSHDATCEPKTKRALHELSYVDLEQTTAETADRSLESIAPIAVMTTLATEQNSVPDRSDQSRSAALPETRPHNGFQTARAESYDSNYDGTPPIGSPVRGEFQAPVEDGWGSGFDVDNFYPLRSSTREKVASSTKHINPQNTNENVSTLGIPMQHDKAPIASEEESYSRTTPERRFIRRRNISGRNLPSFGDEAGDKDLTYTPTKASKKKRTSTHRPASPIDEEEAFKARRQATSPQGKASLWEKYVSSNKMSPAKMHIQQSSFVDLGNDDEDHLPENNNVTHQHCPKRSSSSAFHSILSPSTPTTHDTSAPRKRRRLTLVCTECRRKKVKCDGEDPCSRCKNPRNCTYKTGSNNPRSRPSNGSMTVSYPVDPRMSSPAQPALPQDHEVSDAIDNALSNLEQGRGRNSEAHQLPSPKPSNHGGLEQTRTEVTPKAEPPTHVNMNTLTHGTEDPPLRPFSDSAVDHMGTKAFRERDSAIPPGIREEPRLTPLKTSYRMDYFIITNIPRPSRQNWPNGTILDKSLDALFGELSDFLQRNDLREIKFVLNTSLEEVRSLIRNDEERFTEMKNDFEKAIGKDRKFGIERFRIEMDINPGERQMVKLEEQMDDDDVMLL